MLFHCCIVQRQATSFVVERESSYFLLVISTWLISLAQNHSASTIESAIDRVWVTDVPHNDARTAVGRSEHDFIVVRHAVVVNLQRIVRFVCNICSESQLQNFVRSGYGNKSLKAHVA